MWSQAIKVRRPIKSKEQIVDANNTSGRRAITTGELNPITALLLLPLSVAVGSRCIRCTWGFWSTCLAITGSQDLLITRVWAATPDGGLEHSTHRRVLTQLPISAGVAVPTVDKSTLTMQEDRRLASNLGASLGWNGIGWVMNWLT